MKLLGALSFGLVLVSTIPDAFALPLPGQDLDARNPSLASVLAANVKYKKPYWPTPRPFVPKPILIRNDLDARKSSIANFFANFKDEKKPTTLSGILADLKNKKPYNPYWHTSTAKSIQTRDDLEEREPTFAPTVIWKKPAFPWPKPPPRYNILPVLPPPNKWVRREDNALAGAITDLVLSGLTKDEPSVVARAFEDLELREPSFITAIKKAASMGGVKKSFSGISHRAVSDDEVGQLITRWIQDALQPQPAVSARDDDSDEQAIKQLVKTVQNVIKESQGVEFR